MITRDIKCGLAIGCGGGIPQSWAAPGGMFPVKSIIRILRKAKFICKRYLGTITENWDII